MKIAILGAGAMGSLFGGKLALAGNDVVLYDINHEHIDRVRAQGLEIEEAADGSRQTARPAAADDPREVRGADVLVVFVKSTGTEAVAAQFRDIASPGSIVVTLQNGLGNEEIIRRHFGAERTAAGVTSQGATFLGPGRVRHAGSGPTHLGMADRSNERLAPFVDALNRAGLEAHLDERFERLVWGKLIVNVGINALTALLGVTNGRLPELEDTRALMRELVEEALNVARAAGVEIGFADPVQTVFEVAGRTGRNRSSMLQDFDRRRPSEIDFINGAILREAERLGIDVPVNRTVTRLVRTLDRLHGESP
jgi:2-dehydropantoate 2-reductase